jgi:vitamin B12 transporter
MSSLRRFTLVTCVVLPNLLVAQSGRTPTSLPPEVVTATRIPWVTYAPTATATTLDAAALRAEGITHLADALRRVPGVAIARTSSVGSQVALFVRGGQSNYVRVLVDGVPLNEPGGVLDLGRITLDDIERIEVVRGPASVLYGSEAVSGVIQLFTRRGGGTTKTRAEVGSGNIGTRRLSLGGERTIAGLRATVQGDHHGSTGILPFNNAYRNTGVVSGLTYTGARSDLRLTGRYNSSLYQYPTSSSGAIEDRNAERVEHRLLVGLDGGRRWTDRFETRLQLSSAEGHPRTNDGPDDAADTLGFFGYYTRGTVVRRLADLRGIYRLTPNHTITLGGEFSRETERSQSVSLSEYGDYPGAFRAARETRALYAQGLGERGRFAYSVGARLDDNSAFGTFHTVRAGTSWRLTDGVRLRASAGSAFKAPSFFENFAEGFTVGNAALRPERTESAEFGVEWVGTTGLYVRATGFSQRFRDLIQYTSRTPQPDAPNYYNIAAANAGGMELEGALPEFARTRVSAAYTWTDTRVTDAGFDEGAGANFVAGGRLIRRPEHLATLTLVHRIMDRGSVSAVVTHTGMREDRDFSGWPAAPVELPAFTTLDLSTELPLPSVKGSTSRLQVRVDNATDVRYTQIQGFASPGRIWYLGLKLER